MAGVGLWWASAYPGLVGKGRDGLASTPRHGRFLLLPSPPRQPLHIPPAWPGLSQGSGQLSFAGQPLGLSNSDLRLGVQVGGGLCGAYTGTHETRA